MVLRRSIGSMRPSKLGNTTHVPGHFTLIVFVDRIAPAVDFLELLA